MLPFLGKGNQGRSPTQYIDTIEELLKTILGNIGGASKTKLGGERESKKQIFLAYNLWKAGRYNQSGSYVCVDFDWDLKFLKALQVKKIPFVYIMQSKNTTVKSEY